LAAFYPGLTAISLFHRGKAYFSRAKPCGSVLSNIHPAQMALDTDICTLVWEFISPATKLVIPAEAERRAGIQKRLCDHWIPALAKMTGR
jgi:hypothetical protein